MESIEYQRMFEMEDRHWWFQSRLRMSEGILAEYIQPAFAGRKPHLLDLGCGTGLFLQRRGEDSDSAGLDFSAEALRFSRTRGLRRVMRGDAARLPLRSESFDVVTAFDLIEHVQDDQALVAEAWRVLRPGGFLMASVPAHPSLWSGHDISLHHFRRYTRKSFERLFVRPAWECLRQTGSFALILPPAALVRWSKRLLTIRKPQADTRPVPEWLNRVLIQLHGVEAGWLRRHDLPSGLSLLTLRRKPRV